MVDIMFENVDLLSLVESELEAKRIREAISESEMAIALYDHQTFLVEQDTHIFMELNYGVLTEGVVKNIWEIVKGIFNKLLELMKKFKDYLSGLKEKFKKLKDKIKKEMEKVNFDDPDSIVKFAAKNNPTGRLTKIEISQEVFGFIENYKPLSSCKILQTIIDAVGEFIDFSLNNKDVNSLPPDLFMKKCPSFSKLDQMCDGDANRFLPMIMDDLKLPYKNQEFNTDDIKEYINIETDGCTFKEFYDKYFKNAQKLEEINSKNNDRDVISKDDSKFHSQLTDQSIKLLRMRMNSDEPYRIQASKFMKLNRIISKLYNYRLSFHHQISSACLSYDINMLSCINHAK